MGYSLNVDLTKLDKAMTTVKNYKEKYEKNIKDSKLIINNELRNFWQGKDCNDFASKYEVNLNNEVIIKYLESYHKFLKRAYDEYSKMQAEIQSIASKLPKEN